MAFITYYSGLAKYRGEGSEVQGSKVQGFKVPGSAFKVSGLKGPGGQRVTSAGFCVASGCRGEAARLIIKKAEKYETTLSCSAVRCFHRTSLMKLQ